MEMRKCERGHYYDASVHMSCPYCNRNDGANLTGALGVSSDAVNRTAAMGSGAGVHPTMPLSNNDFGVNKTVAMGKADDNKTVALFQTEQGIDPVVGWLICLSGKEKGKDYRIHSDHNYIGRSSKMDICIQKDDSISRENQAILSFDAMDNSFYLQNGEGKSLVRINGKAVLAPTQLHKGDRIKLGRTYYLFHPLCGEVFAWDQE